MYQIAQQVQLTLFPLTYLDLVIANEGRRRVELLPPYFFLDRELLLIDLKLGTHLSNLKTFKRVKQLLKYDVTFFTHMIYQHFLQETSLSIDFVRLQTLVLFFLCFPTFCKFKCLFYNNTFVLIFIL